jgi:shikimate dehydrogenase
MTRKLGIIGHPVAHSLSPVFQSAALRQCGFDATYEHWDTTPAELGTRIASLREPGFIGANVTIPHKQAALPLLDEVGGLSAAIGAVNTIVNRDGRLYGFNTDGPGFVRSLRAEIAFEPAGKSMLLLGAGGAARGIAFALLEAGVERLTIANRSRERAEALVHDLTSSGNGRVRVADFPAVVSGYDCIVNTTSVGMHGTDTETESPCSFAGASAGAVAVDIVYAPAETVFLREAATAGLRVLGGLPMLIYQGALSFELWTGVAAPVDAMFDVVRSELARRQSMEGVS